VELKPKHLVQNRLTKSLIMLATIIATGCGGPSADDAPRFKPIDPEVAGFWDRQTTENAALLKAIADEFNANNDGPPIKVIQSGNYADIYTKTIAAIKAKTLPAMAVAYGNMTVEYAKLNAVVDLGELMNDPEVGFTQEELDDFYPAVLEQNRYPDLDNRVFSFPYTKAVLVMYCNTDVTSAAGLERPPETWDDFLKQCRVIKQHTGKAAFSFDVDASTINGMIFSRGGDILKDGNIRYDTPEALATLEFLGKLFEEKLAYQNPPRTFSDQTAFGNDDIAFSIRPSSSRPYYELVKEGLDGWLISPIPQSDPANPSTVLYGANISIFNTNPEQIQSAWAFTKFFTSVEMNVRWALHTGYLPYRKSAVDHPELQAYWAKWPYNRTAFDCLPSARSEPNIQGWQEVRRYIENAATAVITGLKTPDEAVANLQREIEVLQARQARIN